MKVGDIITGTFSPGSLFLVTKLIDNQALGIALKNFTKTPGFIGKHGFDLWSFVSPTTGEYIKVAESPLSQLELLVFEVVNEI